MSGAERTALPERRRLEDRAQRLEYVLEAMRRRMEDDGANHAERGALQRAIDDFGREFGEVRARLRATGPPRRR